MGKMVNMNMWLGLWSFTADPKQNILNFALLLLILSAAITADHFAERKNRKRR